MVSFSRILTAMLVTSITTVVHPSSAPETRATTSTTPALTMSNLPDEQIAIVRHAVGLYAEAGLVLPAVNVRGYADPAACHNKLGLHIDLGTTSAISLCTRATGTVGLRLILHELAHAWVAANLADATKAEFRQLRGWRFWFDYEHAAWADNGSEQAAEILMWGLIDHDVDVRTIDHATCTELHAGFVTLAGREPLPGRSTAGSGCDDIATAVVHRS